MAAGRRCEAFEPRLVAGVEDPTPSPLLSSSQARTVGTRDVSPEKGPGPSCGPKEEQWDIVKAEETEVGDPGLQGPLLPAGGPGSLTLHPTTHSLPDASRSPEAPHPPPCHPFLAQSRHARRPFGDALMSPC